MKGCEGMRDKGSYAYMRVYNDLRSRIENGELQYGSRLDTEFALTEKYKVSRDTVRKALSMLESDGFIDRRASLGTHIRSPKTNYTPRQYHESFTEQMLKLGKKPSSQVRSIEMLTELDRHIAVPLEAEDGERIYRISRVRLADNEPMAYEIAYVRYKYCPNIHTLIYDDSSIYKIYEEHYKLNMGLISLKAEAIPADPLLQKVLKIKSGDAVLKITSLMRLEDGAPLYYVECYHRGDRYVMTTTMPRHM